MSYIRKFKKDIEETLEKLEPLNMYKQEFHIDENWGVIPLKNGLLNTQKAIDSIVECFEHLILCRKKIKHAILIKTIRGD